MSNTFRPKKKLDLPPKGRRNADPITAEPGSHPIEAGVGAAVLGAATGFGGGAVGGPVGAAIGAAVGAVAGGYAGKSVGEMIDPTIEDMWLRDNFESRPYVKPGETFATYQPAYRYGGEVEYRYRGDCFDQIEDDLERDWQSRGEEFVMPWKHAREAVKDSYERTAQIRRARDVAEANEEEVND